jgi:outer membrane protein TolC
MMFRREKQSGYKCAALGSAFFLSLAAPAFALQPLRQFLDGALDQGLDTRKAAAEAGVARAQAAEIQSGLFPVLSASGSRDHEQYQLPQGWGGDLAADAYAGSLQVNLSVVDVGKWMASAQAGHSAEAAENGFTEAKAEVERKVACTYYRLIGAEALKQAYSRSQDTAAKDLDIAQAKKSAGAATDLDVAQARVELASAAQGLVETDLEVSLDARALRSLCALEPTSGFPDLDGETAGEPALAVWEALAEKNSPILKAARERWLAAEDSARAAKAAVLPVAGLSYSQSGSSASNPLTGTYDGSLLAGTLTWQFGLPNLAAISAAERQASVETTAEAIARRDLMDAVNEAWLRVQSGVAQCRAADAKADAARVAAQMAQVRFEAGSSSHQDEIQAQRDLITAESERISARTGLLYARAFLRLTAGVDPLAAVSDVFGH